MVLLKHDVHSKNPPYLGAVYMSPVCRASPFKQGARFHYNFLLKIILLYMQSGLARLGGISLDSNGAPGQPGLNLSASRASIEFI